jgi:hypothetical protein
MVTMSLLWQLASQKALRRYTNTTNATSALPTATEPEFGTQIPLETTEKRRTFDVIKKITHQFAERKSDITAVI